MCGIVGELLYQQGPRGACEAMLHALTHRGPDFQQLFDLGPLRLGHSRLAIVDLNPNANQPMFSQDQQYCIVCNGELYNYRDLRKELEVLGHTFITQGDTEVMLLAWQEWAEAALDKFIGMFAFAIWDNKAKTLFLARDRMGEKPLFFFEVQAGLIFASELKALAQHPLVKTQLNEQALNQYLSYSYVLTGHCIYRDVRKLPPAHYLKIQPNKPATMHCYWDLAACFKQAKGNRSQQDYLEEWQQLFSEAVQQQLCSDVKFGSFLSGGIDSSAITSAMKRFCKKINSYSIDFEHESFSELDYSRKVAKHLGVSLHHKTVEIKQADQLIQAMRCYGEPFADTSAIPCYYLAQYAKEQVTVCLSGDGGDELFAGYETYMADKWHAKTAWLPRFLFSLSDRASALLPASFDKLNTLDKIRRFSQGAQFEAHHAHTVWRQIFSEQNKQQLCNNDLYQKFINVPYYDQVKFFKEVEGVELLNQFLYVDMKTWLVDDILVKVDRSSMAHALEVRAPFLNHKLVEFSARLPARFKINGQTKKYLLKESQSQLLPHSIIYRKKSGFSSPVSHWLLGAARELMRDVLSSNRMKKYFNFKYMNTLASQHEKRQYDHGQKLFNLLCFGLWLEQQKI